MNIIEIKKDIDSKINDITKELNLKQSEDKLDQLSNCVKLQKYIVQNNNEVTNLNDDYSSYDKNTMRTLQLRDAVLNNSSVGLFVAVEFQEILKRIGINVECVGMSNRKGQYHMANLVLLGNEWYLFDPNREIALYNSKNGNNLNYAGLGTNSYLKDYQPEIIMPYNNENKKVPQNLAKEDIPSFFVNSIEKRKESKSK